jgi:hypothetical protein
MAEECIFKIDPNVSDNNEYEFFGHKKKNDFLDDLLNPRIKTEKALKNDKDVYAKTITNNGKTRFFVRVDDRRNIFDPNPLVTNQSNTLLKRTDEVTNFIEVNPKVFELYVNYLRTLNRSWLSKANKENN